MGGNQSQVSNIGTLKGQGYRILSVRVNSPLQPLVDVFFDFIVDVISSKQPEKSPKDILQKLTQTDSRRIQRQPKTLQEIFKQNENTLVTVKIVSTKYRNVRTVQVTPNSNWNGQEDLMGISTRLQRYDQAFQTYFPISDIRLNSPIKKANIVQGQYLIGCLQFPYTSISKLLENIYDRYFDKAIQSKVINIAVYNIVADELRIVPVTLARGWGQAGLLGCQFLQGHLNKFPKNLSQVRQTLKMKKKMSDQGGKVRKQLSECNGASVQLIQSLKNQKNKRKKSIKLLKSMLLIQPNQDKKVPPLVKPLQRQKQKQKKQQTQQKTIKPPKSQIIKTKSEQQLIQFKEQQQVSIGKFKQLQNRVTTLQQMISNIRNYIQEIPDSDEQA